jgi:NAD(P)-dependent dehydrogenase (short-subunit alcohol dehydrogenase family)
MTSNRILIVGGTSGIGQTLVEQLFEAGHELFVLGRSESPVDLPDGVNYEHCDVLSEDLESATLPEDLDGLAYCPGSITIKPFGRTSESTFQEDWDINVRGAIRVLQQAESSLKNGDSPSYGVFFSTVATQVGLKYHASIAAAKSALEGVVKSLAAEWAPSVRLNVIAPSLTETPMAQPMIDSETKRERSVSRHPTQSINQPEEVAHQASLLLTGGMNVTGQLIPMDGGMSSVRTD